MPKVTTPAPVAPGVLTGVVTPVRSTVRESPGQVAGSPPPIVKAVEALGTTVKASLLPPPTTLWMLIALRLVTPVTELAAR